MPPFIFKHLSRHKSSFVFAPESSLRYCYEVFYYITLDYIVTTILYHNTYITNLIHASVDPKTIRYFAGREDSKITIDIYAKVKYNKPKELIDVVNKALGDKIWSKMFFK